MARLLTCPRGHRWPEPPLGEDGTAVLPTCPVCGADAAPQAETGTIQGTLQPPRPPSPAPAVVYSRTLPMSGPEAPPPSPPPSRWPTVPGYEILRELGRGGMGVVYKAKQTALNRVVALKMIRAGTQAGSEELMRFKIEAEAVAALQHPNIVQIYEVGEYEGLPFFSLEYVDGGSLQKRMTDGLVPARQAADLVEALARAIHHAHQRGVVHRDLKPANILLASGGRQPPDGAEADPSGGVRPPLSEAVPKITDFGLAKRLRGESGHTGTGAILGTPSYMAPEQAAGRAREIGPACDIYALGAILYDLLTGRPPFRGDSVMETLKQVLDVDPVPPSSLQPGLPRDLEIICLKCLQKAPAQRYATAEALAEDLRRWRVGEPIRARATPAWERAVKWARRRPAAASLLAAAAVALLAVAADAVWYADHERRRADEEARLRGQAEREHEEATREEQRARGNFRDAVDAIEELLEEAARHRPEDLPSLRGMYEDQLARAERFFRRFLHEGGGDGAARREDALARTRLAILERKRGRPERSLALCDEALAELEGLLQENPEQSDLWTARVAVRAERGAALAAAGRGPEALRADIETAAAWRERVARFPRNPPVQPTLGADIYYQCGRGRAAGDPAAADDFRSSREEMHRLLARGAPGSGYRYRLARACSALGAAEAAAGRAAEAAAAYDEAVAVWGVLVREYPHAVDYALNLAEAHRGRGLLPGRPSADARSDLEKAAALLAALPEDYAALPRYRQQWADAERDADEARRRAAAPTKGAK
jgi:hypothetical protein